MLFKLFTFKLADIGEGIQKVEVLQWHVQPGDSLEMFGPICEVQSDKATVDITSPFEAKVIKRYMEKGATALVGQPLVDLDVDDSVLAGAASDPSPAPQAETGGPKPAAAATTTAPPKTSAPSTPRSTKGKSIATPAVRRICKENGIDLQQIEGTGKDGRVMKEDVLRFIESGGQSSAAATRIVPSREDRVVPITGIKKAMVKSMTEANAIPTFGAGEEINITRLIELRDDLRRWLGKDSKIKLTFMPFFFKALSLALLKFPELNAYTNADCTELIVKGSHNIGFAMDTPMGLLVPNVKNVQDKSILDLAAELTEITQRGAAGKLSQQDLSDGTFSLSNIGSIGGTYCRPVIMPPQVAIGAIGRARKLPRFVESSLKSGEPKIEVVSTINIGWSADHRVVDGATMVRFSNLWKDYLETPARMVLDLR